MNEQARWNSPFQCCRCRIKASPLRRLLSCSDDGIGIYFSVRAQPCQSSSTCITKLTPYTLLWLRSNSSILIMNAILPSTTISSTSSGDHYLLAKLYIQIIIWIFFIKVICFIIMVIDLSTNCTIVTLISYLYQRAPRAKIKHHPISYLGVKTLLQPIIDGGKDSWLPGCLIQESISFILLLDVRKLKAVFSFPFVITQFEVERKVGRNVRPTSLYRRLDCC